MPASRLPCFVPAKSSQIADPQRAMGLDRLLLRFGLFSKLDSYRLPFVLVHSDYYLSFSMSFIEVTKSFGEREGPPANKECRQSQLVSWFRSCRSAQSIVITILPRACPVSIYRRASGVSLNL